MAAPAASPARHSGSGPRNPGGSMPDPVVVPFTAAAHQHTEPVFDVTYTPGTTVQQIPPIDIPAFGYARHIRLEVSGAGGALGGGAANADYPFNVFSSISLNDVNGAPIFGPLDGYATMVANLFGGYVGVPDPRNTLKAYSASAVTPNFVMRIPLEISQRDGFGSLANQNAAAAYKLYLSINTLANIITGGAPTAPALRIRGFLEAWTLPNETDVAGRRQAEIPPGLGTGQFWSSFTKAMAVGSNTVLLPRVGNLIRNIVIIARNAAGVRVDTVMPDPVNFQWDGRIIRTDTQQGIIEENVSQINGLVARDAGVFGWSFADVDHGLVGDDTPTFWLPTVQSTRLQLDGVSAVAGSLQILTNDVAPAEVIPQERYVETATGFHPQIGIAGPAVM